MKTNALRILMLTFVVSTGFPALADTPSLVKTGKACKAELAKAYPSKQEANILLLTGGVNFRNPMRVKLADFAKYDGQSVAGKNLVARVEAVVKNCEKTCGGLPITNPRTQERVRFKCVKEGGGIKAMTPDSLHMLLADNTILADTAMYGSDAEAEDALMSQTVVKPDAKPEVKPEVKPKPTATTTDAPVLNNRSHIYVRPAIPQIREADQDAAI